MHILNDQETTIHFNDILGHGIATYRLGSVLPRTDELIVLRAVKYNVRKVVHMPEDRAILVFVTPTVRDLA